MGWLRELYAARRTLEPHDHAVAEATARVNIFTASEVDRERARRRDELHAEPVVRWRCQLNRWERWSQVEERFVEAAPPESLVTFAASSGGPVDGQVLSPVDGTWRPVDSDAALAAPASAGMPVAADVAAAADEPAAFEAQLAAWRRRNR